MSYTETNQFTASDIAKILKQCRETGVKTIKIGDIEIEFNQQFTSFETPSKIKPKWIDESIEETQKRLDEEQLELQDLAILDPVEWERLATMDGE